MLPVALIQMAVAPGEKEKNLRRAREMIRAAADRGARLAVLPEALPLGWTDASSRHQADPIPDGASFRLLRDAARAHGIYLCSGLVERAGDQLFNSAVLLGPGGELLLHHRKINELAMAHDLYGPGQSLATVATPIGTIGLMICSDGFAQGQCLSRALGYLGADLILSSCSWAVPADHDPVADPYGKLWLDNYLPVARHFHLWIIAVSNVGPIRSGPWQGRKCIGCSMAISPEGERVAAGPYGEAAEALLLVEIEVRTRPARGDQWAPHLERPASA